MHANRTHVGSRWGGRIWLTVLIHYDAIRAAPRAYLTALWWRLCGKRLRARARFAPLLGTSPRAYRLWLKHEQFAGRMAATAADPAILALVETGGAEQRLLDETLRSLAGEGVQTLQFGTPAAPSLVEAVKAMDASGTAWLMPLSAGDVVARGAGAAYRRAAALARTRVVYADDDLLDRKGRRTAPHFKPDWNGELFRHFDFVTGAAIVRASAAEMEGLPEEGWARRLVARVAAAGGAEHIPQVLHHRRTRPSPCALPAVEMRSANLPLVSVIVPTRNRVELLRTCIEGLTRTAYPKLEVLVVDNDSDDPATLDYLADLDGPRCRVLRQPGPFNFSALNNRAVAEARGELLCLLNNDIEVIDPDWLTMLATQAMRDEVGAVGAQLLYPDGRIQHAGVVMGVGGGAAHAHRLLRPDEEGYFRRHQLPQYVSAVTAACLVVRHDRFVAVGGLDERNFAVAFNDVDLCMKLNSRGWQSFYEPRARLIHQESVSRGLDRDPAGAARLARELAALKRLWGTGEMVDPFHHPQLSPHSERFVVRV